MVVECATLSSAKIGVGCVYRVPLLVAGGLGTLCLGEKNSFGLYMAPRFGNGAVLIQPRSRDSMIAVGSDNSFSNNVALCANERIVIGNGCQIGDQVAIYDCDFHEISPITRNRSCGSTAPVHIGNNVWIGSRVMVLKGVTIGDNSVVGAMSVVSRSLPPNCVAVGIPARIVHSIKPVPRIETRPHED